MSIREYKQLREREFLSEYATLSMNSRGRVFPEQDDDVRTCFERDRDRIIHSKSFRRLKDKTQVFISPEGDHYRTRLTHTLEVSQIARSIAVALRLNESLTEAIALGHDLGHTPFGHTGEAVLDEILKDTPLGGFEHSIHSLRIVDILERNGNGLNLTYEVRDGIITHSTGSCPETPEGKVVQFSDKIAYINHDIDDAIRAGIITEADLPKECIRILGDTHSKRINTMIVDIVRNSQDKNTISKSREIEEATAELRAFMFANVYIGSEAKSDEDKAKNVVKSLFEYFVENPQEMGDEYYNRIINDGIERSVCDYIAGMTDSFAVKKYKSLFIPNSWI
ncbi:MAG: deoxyguanosinetriphosphate triphosphohydrolase [Anaerofustis stercorihominis]|nr:deoxyguanosinetriphosphate triphosphohydrolase [Anaerofustis stercorihominis]